ncbi:cytochrome [Achromobacter xylosoxidans]|uniref:cytochrome n=1 Tax=Alcaligenes xylosoxydans xylosoxydans TaxID=85698 RepID=UPI001F05F78F|nr:cytochrome [Achromobacter xylosoxidans]MCH1990270.1 cytochrome [Achromobacter xylosoxidans]MCH4589937.1 cytochrome [Achromobacter xylosoxidans]
MSTPFPTDPLQAVTHADPYPYYAALARDRPLYRDARLGLWVASAPGTIRDIMRHPAARVRPMAEPVPRGIAAGPAGLLFGRFLRMNDGPRQARLKALFRAFLARQAPLAPAPDWPRLEMDTGSAGAIDLYLHAAPVFAQACALGLPGAVAAECAREVGAFLAALPPAAPEDRVAAGHTAAERLLARLGAHLDDRAASPALRELRGRGADAGLEPALLAANLAGLLFQSCEAGAGLLGNALLRAGRQRAGAALTLAQAWELVDATLRHDPPIHNTRRFLAGPIELEGQLMQAGETVLLVLAAAAMAQPEAHWTFGAQSHACPGRDAARRDAAGALVHLLRAGVDGAALAARFRYRPLPNARIPQFDFTEEPTP